MLTFKTQDTSEWIKQMYYKFLLLLLWTPFVSCSEEKPIPITEAKLITELYELNDSILFGQIGDIELHDEFMFFSDKNSNRVFVLDSNFQFLRTIGEAGSGPNEIKGIKNIAMADSTLFVQDLWGGKLLNYSLNGDLLKTINIKLNSGDFDVLGSDIIGKVIGQHELPFTKYSITNSKRDFGKPLIKEDGFPDMHVRVIEQKIVTANLLNRLNVDIYDDQGILLGENSLDHIPVVQDWLAGLDIEGKINASTANTAYAQTTFYDIDIVDNHIFFSLPPLGSKNGVKKNFIIEAILDKNNKITVTRKIFFEGYFAFNCFSITADLKYLIGFNSSNGSIVKYHISSKEN
ncbi:MULTISPECIES: 6-bladed beta-propeller [Roseivirga]|uniref:6-bladed beta-propeller n=1 Tax=Roseivirga thermotolerans TaxID=1758176 RepID=A0ABQ3I9R9_9BACT|nr:MULTISPECIES: 6-bladed beta-propeller [Roseivirga]MEC7752680.1 6-bladed beta-propeller [Bacteroidota bacterium]GHE66396.1 hypothetical protein GCM10011340_22120 [Roseivirga thermotolerans]|tara:strand:- start:5545 stop:6585 length:1041 start_codon:yes stop_codon:yes gene_type:complete